MGTETSAAATHIELSKDGNVATVTFSSERGVNVFSSAVLGELGRQVELLAEDSELRYVVFRGAGKTFVAGADITEMSAFDEAQGIAFAKHGHHVFDTIENLPQVTFAALNGHALGGGCELAIACDFRIMSGKATIGQPESVLGLIPGWGGTIRLRKLVGLTGAKRLLFSGQGIKAEQAREIGLVDEVVENAEALDAALKRWFELIAHGAPRAITRIKRAIAHDDEIHQFGCCFSCDDAHEGMTAFIEKRPPNWKT